MAFDGVKEEIGDIKFTMKMSFIAKEYRLSWIREKWFKNRGIGK